VPYEFLKNLLVKLGTLLRPHVSAVPTLPIKNNIYLLIVNFFLTPYSKLFSYDHSLSILTSPTNLIVKLTNVQS